MKKEQINWLREEPVELQDITIKEFKPFPVEATDLDNEIADTIHYLARINVLSKEIERLNNIINELEKYCNNEIEEGNKALGKLSTFYNSSDTESYIKGQQAKCKHILDKLQKLKGDGSNEKDTNE